MSPTHATSDTFKDISQNLWAKEEINYLYQNDIIGGYRDGTFRSTNPITRLQAARMIVKALDLNTKGRPAPNLNDIDKTFTDYDLVATVVDEGIINGRNGNFMPGAPLTRGQMAAILVRAFDLKGTWDGEFNDIHQTYTFYDDIHALAANGITTGFSSDHTFRPGQNTTRAHFSVFLTRTLQGDQTSKQPVQEKPDQGISAIEAKVIELTNDERRKKGLLVLKADNSLGVVAREKSNDMQTNNYFSHTSPTYGSPFDMLNEFNVSYYKAGENIAKGHQTAEQVVKAWMNSEGHRANILNKDFTHIGIGYNQNGHYWTQMFIRK